MAETVIRVPKRQHTVSRVVLRSFTRENKISVFDRDRDLIHSTGTGGAFYVQNFDPHDPLGAEERWGRVEQRMPQVYKRLAARTALDDPECIATLRDLLAVHWVRSSAMLAAKEALWRQVLENSKRDLATRRSDLLARSFQKELGLVPAGQADLDWFSERVHERVAASDAVAEENSRRVLVHYEYARTKAAESEIQIGYAHGLDFMISDAPVLTMKPSHDGVGPHQGVALGDATHIGMPISKNIMVALGPARAMLELDAEIVERYNQLQWRASQRWIGCCPGGKSDIRMRAESTAKTILPHVR